jgi:hypothetical protein
MREREKLLLLEEGIQSILDNSRFLWNARRVYLIERLIEVKQTYLDTMTESHVCFSEVQRQLKDDIKRLNKQRKEYLNV